jgi:signal transduction histidine kinase
MEAAGSLAVGVAHELERIIVRMDEVLARFRSVTSLERDVTLELSRMQEVMSLRVGRLTRELLIIAGRAPGAAEPCDFDATLIQLMPALHELTGPHVRIYLKLSASPATVRANPAELELALVNLVLNSRDRMGGHGILRISTKTVALDQTSALRLGMPPGTYLSSTFADTGPSIASEHADVVFDPRASGAGLGIRLASVYAFARQAGGHVDASTQGRVGASFCVHLPICP